MALRSQAQLPLSILYRILRLGHFELSSRLALIPPFHHSTSTYAAVSVSSVLHSSHDDETTSQLSVYSLTLTSSGPLLTALICCSRVLTLLNALPQLHSPTSLPFHRCVCLMLAHPCLLLCFVWRSLRSHLFQSVIGCCCDHLRSVVCSALCVRSVMSITCSSRPLMRGGAASLLLLLSLLLLMLILVSAIPHSTDATQPVSATHISRSMEADRAHSVHSRESG